MRTSSINFQEKEEEAFEKKRKKERMRHRTRRALLKLRINLLMYFEVRRILHFCPYVVSRSTLAFRWSWYTTIPLTHVLRWLLVEMAIFLQ
jgi:hypothetical protein